MSTKRVVHLFRKEFSRTQLSSFSLLTGGMYRIDLLFNFQLKMKQSKALKNEIGALNHHLKHFLFDCALPQQKSKALRLQQIRASDQEILKLKELLNQ